MDSHTPPPPPPPDAKDWTWVLERTCPECGFDAGAFPASDVADGLRRCAVGWQQALRGDEATVRQRTRSDVWSTLEYGCHVRDVIAIYRERVTAMLTDDGPHYANWDQDAAATESRYDLADPATVAGEIAEGADLLAEVFDGVTGVEWKRTGYRSDGAAFTVDTISRYFLHDLIHHLNDVGVSFKDF